MAARDASREEEKLANEEAEWEISIRGDPSQLKIIGGKEKAGKRKEIKQTCQFSPL